MKTPKVYSHRCREHTRSGAEFSISGTDAQQAYDCVTLDMHAGSRADTRAPVLILLSACD